jgi:hypothetical protein
LSRVEPASATAAAVGSGPPKAAAGFARGRVSAATQPHRLACCVARFARRRACVQGQQEAAAVGVELNGHFVEGQRHLEQNTHTHAPPQRQSESEQRGDKNNQARRNCKSNIKKTVFF